MKTVQSAKQSGENDLQRLLMCIPGHDHRHGKRDDRDQYAKKGVKRCWVENIGLLRLHGAFEGPRRDRGLL